MTLHYWCHTYTVSSYRDYWTPTKQSPLLTSALQPENHPSQTAAKKFHLWCDVDTDKEVYTRGTDYARAFTVFIHSLPFPLHYRGYFTPGNTVISSNRFHIWILFFLGALGKQEHSLKWAFMPQSASGQGSAPKPLRPSHGCWFHLQTERASQQDTASLLFSSHSLIASLWQVKCQETGRGGVWRRRDKRFSPSINLKTYSADNLNGTGISFSMVTRDGRRLGKKKKWVQTRENPMLKTQGNLQTLQFLFAVQVAHRREKSPFLACTVWEKPSRGHDEGSFLQAAYWCRGRKSLILHQSYPEERQMTSEHWKFGKNADYCPPEKKNCLKEKRYCHFLYSTSCLQIKATDADSGYVPALTTTRSGGLTSLSLSALHLMWKKTFVTSVMPNNLDAQIKTRNLFILF